MIPLLASLIALVQPPVDLARLDTGFRVDFRADRTVSGFLCMTGDSSLYHLVAGADRVVVGKVLGVVRHEHYPPATTAAEQRTVYAIQVESDIVGSGASVFTVKEVGGPLPWSEDGRSGVGYRELFRPMLAVGERYLLFLKDAKTHRERLQGFRQTIVSGRTYIDTDLDTLSFLSPDRSKVLLHDGRTFAADTARDPKTKPWTLEGWPDSTKTKPESQVLDITEAEAIARIQAMHHTVQALLHPANAT